MRRFSGVGLAAFVVFALFTTPAEARVLEVSGKNGCNGIPGSAGWLNTGIEVEAGDRVVACASGTYFRSQTAPALGPEGSGTPGGAGFCEPTASEWALLGNVGGMIFEIGANYSEPNFPTSGTLLIGFNDDDYSDNTDSPPPNNPVALVGFGAMAGGKGSVQSEFAVNGLSTGAGWSYELRNTDGTGAGLIASTVAANTVPAGGSGRALAQAWSINMSTTIRQRFQCISNTGVDPFGAPLFSYVAPGPGGLALWVSDPGGPGPVVRNVNAAGDAGVEFNPTVTFVKPPLVPSLEPRHLIVLASLLALTSAYVIRRMVL